MGNKTAVRHMVDLLMTVVLVLLMAYFLTEQEIHEWLGAGISACGVYAFARQHIADYLFLRSHFVFFDYERPPVLYFLDLLSMMGLWIALSYYLGKALRSRTGRTSNQSQISEEDKP